MLKSANVNCTSEIIDGIIGTVPSGKAMNAVLGGLAVNGKLIMIGLL
jgi:hypothetical protein